MSPCQLSQRNRDADEWLERFEEAAAYNNWNDEKMCRNVYVALDRASKAWANRMKNELNPPERWSTVQYAAQQTREARQAAPNAPEVLPQGQGIRERFIEVFMSDTHQVSVGMKLKRRVQRADESAINYYYDVMELCDKKSDDGGPREDGVYLRWYRSRVSKTHY